MDKLSKYFTYKEFIKSHTAMKHGIDNTPTPRQLSSMVDLCRLLLDNVREKFGPIKVTSGYRSIPLCILIGSSKDSQHAFGEAADIEAYDKNVSNAQLAQWILENTEFDQLILEYYDESDPKSGWVHVSYTTRYKNRKEALIARREGGKTIYERVKNFLT